MRAAERFLDVLEAAGIDTLFGLPGSTEAPLLEAVRHRTMGEWSQALGGVTAEDRHYVARVLEGIAGRSGNGASAVPARGLTA